MSRAGRTKGRRSLHGKLFVEALRHQLAKQERHDVELSPEELRKVEPYERYWQTRASELVARTTPERPHDELLARVQELARVARALGLAHLADGRYAAGLVDEELHAHVAALEAAVAAESSHQN